jgi:hypothetical protein
MVWLTPSMISGSASGSFTLRNICPRRQPAMTEASTISGGTRRMPWSA